MEEKLQDETPAPQATTPQAVTEEIIETAPEANPAANPDIPKKAEDIDLNTLYPDEDGDLNALFPEQEIKRVHSILMLAWLTRWLNGVVSTALPDARWPSICKRNYGAIA